MSSSMISVRRVAATCAIAAAIVPASVSAASADQVVSAARAESFVTARAKCVKKLRQSCYPQQLRHISGGRCWVFRGVATGRVGRTYRCPGSPLYVY